MFYGSKQDGKTISGCHKTKADKYSRISGRIKGHLLCRTLISFLIGGLFRRQALLECLHQGCAWAKALRLRICFEALLHLAVFRFAA